MRIAVIPARGGSKRITGKNIKSFCGKPVIGWSIESAIESACFDRIIVSTDDEQIAEIACGYGAEVPFLRPAELSDDYTGTTAVIAHTIRWQQSHGVTPDQVCCIYATAPFLRATDLRRGLQTLEQNRCNYVFSVTTFAFPIQRAIRISERGRVEMFEKDKFNIRSQDLEQAYHDAGQFYWGCTEAWLDEKPIFSSDALPLVLPRHRVQDIDTIEDWVRAEWMFKVMNQ